MADYAIDTSPLYIADFGDPWGENLGPPILEKGEAWEEGSRRINGVVFRVLSNGRMHHRSRTISRFTTHDIPTCRKTSGPSEKEGSSSSWVSPSRKVSMGRGGDFLIAD